MKLALALGKKIPLNPPFPKGEKHCATAQPNCGPLICNAKPAFEKGGQAAKRRAGDQGRSPWTFRRNGNAQPERGRILGIPAWPALACCLLLAGCGFHLREPAHLPAAMQRTYIADSGGNTELVRELRRNLNTAVTSVTDDATQATATLNILNAQRFQRVLSVSNIGQPLEYQVAYRVQFSLTTTGKTLIAPQTLTLTRNYAYDVANTLGDTEQANVLYKAMEDNMAQLILFRLEAAGRAAGGH